MEYIRLRLSVPRALIIWVHKSKYQRISGKIPAMREIHLFSGLVGGLVGPEGPKSGMGFLHHMSAKQRSSATLAHDQHENEYWNGPKKHRKWNRACQHFPAMHDTMQV